MPAKKTRDAQSRRRFSAREIQSHWQSLDEAFRIQQQATRAKVEAVKGDIVAFFREICCELRKDGGIGYSHPSGTHDDVFWSVPLAIFASVEMAPEPYLAVIPRSFHYLNVTSFLLVMVTSKKSILLFQQCCL
ncbi:MAG: hypothetical protein ACM3JE_04165 [Betaproteobacteria bacterium]